MKIYINSNYEIKAINSPTDETLTEYEVVREEVFGTMSDFMILNYCYKPSEGGYSIYPSKDYTMLEMLDKQENKISILTEKQEATTVAITSVEKDQIVQDIDIKDNMLACVELCDMVLALMDTQPQIFNTKGVINHMAKIYAKLIIEGDITIEDVPSRYRIEVERLLAVMDK